MSTDQSRPEQLDAEPNPIQDTVQFEATGPESPAQPAIPAAEPRPDEPEAPVAPVAPRRAGPRVGTVVWGLVLAVIGAGVIAAAAGYEFDLELASIALLALAGIGLVIGSIATSARRRSR